MQHYRITRDKFLAERQVRQLLLTCQQRADLDVGLGKRTWPQRYMLVRLTLGSGLRVSEVAALKLADIHLSDREAFLVVQKGKGGKKRDVYLDQELAAHLAEFIQLKETAWKEPTGPDAPLFAGRGGRHYTTTALHISFKKALAAAGLPPGYSIHSARHTYATLLLAKTKNLRFVQKQLGHASLSMTAHYADVLPELNQALANAILD